MEITYDFLCKNAKWIGGEFAKKSALKSGIAHYKYMVFKFDGKLYVIEFTPINNELKEKIKIIDY